VLKKNDTLIDPDLTQMSNVYSLILTGDRGLRMLEDYIDSSLIDYSQIVTWHNKLLELIVIKIDPLKKKIFGNIQFNTQVFTSNTESMSEAVEITKAHNLTIVDVDSCITQMKTHHKINDDLMILKSEQKSPSGKGKFKNEIFISYYHLYSRALLDSSICKSVKSKIQVPIKMPTYEREQYDKFLSQGVDIYNMNQPAFRTKCNPLTDPVTGFDTGVGYRLAYYFRNRTECTDNGCMYSSLTADGFINCDCENLYTPEEINESSGILTCLGEVDVYKRLYIARF
jgi:hypothetical protein